MKFLLPLSLLLQLIASSDAAAQKSRKKSNPLPSLLQGHVQFLADDRLEGRRTGTTGEQLAAAYISARFREIGLLPKGSNEFLQAFDIAEGKGINKETFLQINDTALKLHEDFFPLAISPNISMEVMPSIALQEPDMPWFFDLKELIAEVANNPHFDLEAAIARSAREVQKRGASAIFLYNTSGKEDGLRFNGKDRSPVLDIPLVYLSPAVAKKLLADETAPLDIKMKIDIGERKRTGHNVVGFIDNGASNTVVLGAHYDHLGYGEDGNSMLRNATGAIHNGADDNASGTAALIELARALKNDKHTNNNYLFIAFSGEELGLYGSKYFTQQPTINLSTVNYMINLDMVGRLSDSSQTLTVGGYGTSPFWGEIYNIKGKKRLYQDGLRFRFDSSGTGPSDHTSFYTQNIPVLFYFTGLHTDYHKPGDDADKINYEGQARIVQHILSVIDKCEKDGAKLAFSKTREQQTATTTRFSVTLGVMPDYTFTGAGLRVDGVSEGRPAQKGGIKAGDVILSIGSFNITSMESYMQTLSKFKKGEKVEVKYSRGGQTLSTTVEF